MATCENCGKESEELKRWFVYDTEERKVKVKKVCPSCQEEYEKQAEETGMEKLFRKKLKEKFKD